MIEEALSDFLIIFALLGFVAAFILLCIVGGKNQ